MPTICVAPVRSHCRPITISLSCACAAPAASAIAPAAMATVRQLVLFDIVASSFGFLAADTQYENGQTRK